MTRGGARPGAGRPPRQEPKSKPIWCGQMGEQDRALILEWVPVEERHKVLLEQAQWNRELAESCDLLVGLIESSSDEELRAWIDEARRKGKGTMFLNSYDLQKLVDSEIVEIRGFSGKLATVAQAKHAPTCVQIHAMSGLVFHVMYNATIDQFKLTRTN